MRAGLVAVAGSAVGARMVLTSGPGVVLFGPAVGVPVGFIAAALFGGGQCGAHSAAATSSGEQPGGDEQGDAGQDRQLWPRGEPESVGGQRAGGGGIDGPSVGGGREDVHGQSFVEQRGHRIQGDRRA
jgi:hypothetical protein